MSLWSICCIYSVAQWVPVKITQSIPLGYKKWVQTHTSKKHILEMYQQRSLKRTWSGGQERTCLLAEKERGKKKNNEDEFSQVAPLFVIQRCHLKRTAETGAVRLCLNMESLNKVKTTKWHWKSGHISRSNHVFDYPLTNTRQQLH